MTSTLEFLNAGLAAVEAEEKRADEANRFVLAIYRRPRVVSRRFVAVGRPEAVREDAERALAWYGAHHVTIRGHTGYLTPVYKPEQHDGYSVAALELWAIARKRPVKATTPVDPASTPPSKPSARKGGC